MTAPIVKPVRVEPPLGDRVVWTRRIVDAGGQSLGMISGAPDAFVALLVEAVNDYLYAPDEVEELTDCLESMGGMHDCVLDAGHAGPHACDPDCERDHLTVLDLEAAIDAGEGGATCQVPDGHIFGGEDAAGNAVCSFCEAARPSSSTAAHPDGGWREAVEA